MDTVKNELDTTKTINQLDNCEKKKFTTRPKKIRHEKIYIGQFPNKNWTISQQKLAQHGQK